MTLGGTCLLKRESGNNHQSKLFVQQIIHVIGYTKFY